MPAETLHVGIVGAGGVAVRHAASLARIPGVRVAAVADLDADRAAALAAAHGARSCRDAEEMVAGGLDAAYVCVPPFAHGAPERAVLAAGLPLFVEKPLAADLATAESIAAEVAAAGVVTSTGYHWRYFDTVDAARSALAGAPPLLAVGSWLDKVPPPAWWRRRDRSGGQVVEQATHVLDLFRVLVGEVSSVHALAGRAAAEGADDGAVDDATVALLRFAGGAVGSLVATSQLTWKHHAGVDLYGPGVAVTLTEEALVVRRGADVRRTEPAVDAKSAADVAFVDAVRRGGGGDVRVPYAEALRTHRVACAVADAARDGRTVTLQPGAPHA